MSRKRTKAFKSPQTIIVTIIAIILCLYFAYAHPDQLKDWLGIRDTTALDSLPSTDREGELEGKLQVHFIDVGQGDATLIVTSDGKTALIDAGPNSDEDRLLSYLDSKNVETIDLLFFTHPHEDHIGGGDAVILQYDIGQIIMPDCTSSSSTFERLLSAADKKDIYITTAEHGDTFTLAGCRFEIFGPITVPENDANNASLVIRLTYGDTAFLFSGDAEKTEEEAVLQKYEDRLQADVYQVGHHGSSTSTSQAFLEAIRPSIAVISCGKDNKYGHPHAETLTLLQSLKINIYRTDQSGNILLLSDGKKVS